MTSKNRGPYGFRIEYTRDTEPSRVCSVDEKHVEGSEFAGYPSVGAAFAAARRWFSRQRNHITVKRLTISERSRE